MGIRAVFVVHTSSSSLSVLSAIHNSTWRLWWLVFVYLCLSYIGRTFIYFLRCLCLITGICWAVLCNNTNCVINSFVKSNSAVKSGNIWKRKLRKADWSKVNTALSASDQFPIQSIQHHGTLLSGTLCLQLWTVPLPSSLSRHIWKLNSHFFCHRRLRFKLSTYAAAYKCFRHWHSRR